MSKQIVLKLDKVVKIFGKKIVLQNLSLEVEKGEILGIIGMSGSGKTTLLNTMVGYYQPEAGDILIRGDGNFKSVVRNHKSIRGLIGFAPQSPSFYPKLTVFENLDHYAALYGLPVSIRRANINYLLKLTGIEDSRHILAQYLSGGMQKRLGIACAMIHKPKILMLDEPTADLDPILRRQTWHLIKKINEQGTTVIMASHFLTELETLCTKIAVLYNGRIKQVGSSAELKSHYNTNEEIIFESIPGKYAIIINKLKKEKIPISKIVNKGHKVVIYTSKAEEVLHRLLHVLEVSKEKLLDVDVNKPSLSEVFESMTKKGDKSV